MQNGVFCPFAYAEAEGDAAPVELPVSVSFSTGLTYLKFQQTFPSGNNRNLSFESLDLPYLDILFRAYMSEKVFVKINFLTFAPSSTDSGNNTVVGSKTLATGSLGVEFNYLPFTTSSYRFFKTTSFFGGLQLSALPVLNRTGPTTVDAETFRHNFIRLGATNSSKLSDKWSLLSSFTYAMPLSSQSSYQISGATLLESEFVFLRLLTKNWNVGMGFNIKLHSYSVQSPNVDAITSQPFSAQQENTYSNIYFQTGYTW